MAVRRLYRARTSGVVALLGALLLSGCAASQTSPTTRPPVVATAAPAPPTVAPAPPTAAPVQPTAAPAQPTVAPAPPTAAPAPPTAAPALPTTVAVPPLTQWQWADYTAPDGAWRISYPANLLTPLDMGGGLVIFISADRGHFYGVDSQALAAPSDNAGSRERAVQALTAIYSSRPATITPLAQTDYPWQAGVSFATERGSEGTAAYYLDSSGPTLRRYGTLIGYKREGPMELREALYQTMGRLQLTPASAVTRQDPDPGTTAVAGLLDAWMRGEDVRPS